MVVWYSLCIELRLFIVVPLACGCAVINEIQYFKITETSFLFKGH